MLQSPNDNRPQHPKEDGNVQGYTRKFIKAAGAGGLGAAAAAVAAPAIAQSSPEIRWRLTASWPKSLDTLYGNPEYFAKRVAEITDNKFQIQCFAAGEIVPAFRCSMPFRPAPSKQVTPRSTTISARTRPSRSAPICHSA